MDQFSHLASIFEHVSPLKPTEQMQPAFSPCATHLPSFLQGLFFSHTSLKSAPSSMHSHAKDFLSLSGGSTFGSLSDVLPAGGVRTESAQDWWTLVEWLGLIFFSWLELK